MVIGGGRVAESKIVQLQAAGAAVSVISPEVTPAIEESAQDGRLDWQAREYQPGDLDGVFLGIAATNQREVNQQIYSEAEQKGVLLNVVDDPERCTFIAPSIVERGPVTVAISTGGTSPALARKLREILSNDPALEWADLAGVLSEARKEVKKRRLTVDRQRWQCCLTPELLKLAQEGRDDEALSTLLSGLSHPDTPGLCSRIDKCAPQGCGIQPQQPTVE